MTAQAHICPSTPSPWEDAPRGLEPLSPFQSVFSLPTDRSTPQRAPAAFRTWGLPGGSCLPVPQVMPSSLKVVCDWLELQDENPGLTAGPVLVASLLPPYSRQLAMTTLASPPVQGPPACLWHGLGLPGAFR